MATREQPSAETSLGDDADAHVLFVWALFAVDAVMILITYLHTPVSDLYHVSEGGFTGGLGRVLVFANFPASLVALAMIGLAVRRLRESGMVHSDRARTLLSLVATLGALLCLVTAVPGVVETGDLDAKPVNVLPAIGVAISLGLTIVCLRGPDRFWRMPWSVRDRFAVALIAVLTVISLPWILADLGLYIGDVPRVDTVVMSKEIPEGATLRAVHLGHHHGLDGLLFVTTALVLGRLVRQDVGSGLAATLRGYFGLMVSYGLLNLAEDAWLEQIVKRGWTDRELPDFLVPALSLGWALILAGAVIAWYFLFRPVESEQALAEPMPKSQTGARIPA